MASKALQLTSEKKSCEKSIESGDQNYGPLQLSHEILSFPVHAQLEVELLISPGCWIAAATDNSTAEEVFQRQTWSFYSTRRRPIKEEELISLPFISVDKCFSVLIYAKRGWLIMFLHNQRRGMAADIFIYGQPRTPLVEHIARHQCDILTSGYQLS